MDNRTWYNYEYANDKMMLLLNDFIRINILDMQVEQQLREVPIALLIKVMDYGFFINGNCNSAVVTSRLRKFNTN